MTECKTLPEWDGPTFNGYPHINENSDEVVECVVKTHNGTDDDGNAIYENECGWSGPVSDLARGRSPIGSRPVWLKCPDCGRMLASAKGTCSAGHWAYLDRL